MNAREAADRYEIIIRGIARLRLVQDCLSRALDQAEDDCADDAAWRYVEKQVRLANEYLREGLEALDAGFQFVG